MGWPTGRQVGKTTEGVLESLGLVRLFRLISLVFGLVWLVKLSSVRSGWVGSGQVRSGWVGSS